MPPLTNLSFGMARWPSSGDWAQYVAKATEDYNIHEREVTLELEEFIGGVATGRMLRAGGIASYAI